jgi:hypothetical protein
MLIYVNSVVKVAGVTERVAFQTMQQSQSN